MATVMPDEQLSEAIERLTARLAHVPRPTSLDGCDHCMSAADLAQLERISLNFDSREKFVTELALDPPSATGDLAGAPLLDED